MYQKPSSETPFRYLGRCRILNNLKKNQYLFWICSRILINIYIYNFSFKNSSFINTNWYCNFWYKIIINCQKLKLLEKLRSIWGWSFSTESFFDFNKAYTSNEWRKFLNFLKLDTSFLKFFKKLNRSCRIHGSERYTGGSFCNPK